MMNRVQAVEKILEFLDRTTILGSEAEEMVICKQWLRNTKKAYEAVGQVGGAAAGGPQVADTSGK